MQKTIRAALDVPAKPQANAHAAVAPKHDCGKRGRDGQCQGVCERRQGGRRRTKPRTSRREKRSDSQPRMSRPGIEAAFMTASRTVPPGRELTSSAYVGSQIDGRNDEKLVTTMQPAVKVTHVRRQGSVSERERRARGGATSARRRTETPEWTVAEEREVDALRLVSRRGHRCLRDRDAVVDERDREQAEDEEADPLACAGAGGDDASTSAS